MQQDRTLPTLRLEFSMAPSELHLYQTKGRQAHELRRQGLSWTRIATKLGVSDKTAKKAADEAVPLVAEKVRLYA